MKTLSDVTQILTVIVSLSPFVGVGYYFGRLEKRIKEVEKKAHTHASLTLIKSDKG